LDILSKRLRAIENLPLQVVSVQPVSAGNSFTTLLYSDSEYPCGWRGIGHCQSGHCQDIRVLYFVPISICILFKQPPLWLHMSSGKHQSLCFICFTIWPVEGEWILLNICMLDLIGVLHVPAFRSTDVFPPLPHPLAAEADTQKIPSKPVASHVDPLNILLQLEGSGKWPDDPIGIAKTKSAFCLEIARRYFNSGRSSSK
jgi:hypothetical protein